MSKISWLGALSVALSVINHPSFGEAVKVLDHAKTELEKATPALEVGGTLLTALAPQAGGIVADILGDTDLLSKLVSGVAQLLKDQTPSTFSVDESTRQQP
jgi:hypothetical protein